MLSPCPWLRSTNAFGPFSSPFRFLVMSATINAVLNMHGSNPIYTPKHASVKIANQGKLSILILDTRTGATCIVGTYQIILLILADNLVLTTVTYMYTPKYSRLHL